MRDLVLYAHLILGFALIVLSIVILLESKKKSSWLKPLSAITAGISWLHMIPSASLYITFYPATKSLIKAGAWPWAHLIFMETKEHWSLLVPIIATLAAWLVFRGKIEESKRWWILVIALTVLVGVMGRVVTLGAFI
ncbi:MAG: hypothetical protein ACE5J7_00370 [Candidatus Aenigmatarchaeota archaeon]